MFTITVPDIAACLGVCAASPRNWLTDCPRQRAGSTFTYQLSDVVAALRVHRTRGLNAAEARSLVEVDRVKRSYADDTLFLGEDALPRARRLSATLTRPERERLMYCQSQFTAALVQTLLDRDLFMHIDILRDVLIMHPDVLAYVLTSNSPLPDWPQLAPAFAVINAPTPINEAA